MIHLRLKKTSINLLTDNIIKSDVVFYVIKFKILPHFHDFWPKLFMYPSSAIHGNWPAFRKTSRFIYEKINKTRISFTHFKSVQFLLSLSMTNLSMLSFRLGFDHRLLLSGECRSLLVR